MRILIYIGILAFIANGCASGRVAQVDKPGPHNIISDNGGDEEEYDLIIIDPDFQRWFLTYGRPVNFHSPSYYEQWNQRYASQWNQLAMQQSLSRSGNYPFENQIDYSPHIDYGVELNHELYWYFRYIEALYGNQYDFGFGRGNRLM